MTREEQDPLEFPVVEEEVERPQRALLTIGVRVQIRIIADETPYIRTRKYNTDRIHNKFDTLVIVAPLESQN